MSWELSAIRRYVEAKTPAAGDLLSVFAACVVPVYIWTILIFFSHLEALLLRGTIIQLAGTAGLVLGFALLESAGLFLVILFLNFLLPARLFFQRFTSIGASLAITLSVWAVSIHMQGPFDRKWNIIPLLIGLIIVYVVTQLSTKVANAIKTISNKLIIIAGFYVFLTVVGLVIYLPQLFI